MSKRIKIERCTLFKQCRSPFYNLRVMVKGRRRQFSTGESTKGKACDKAKVILADLKSRGMIETIALHSRRVDEVPADPSFEEFGGLYEKVIAATDYPPAHQTRARYVKSLNLIGTALRISRIRTLTPEKIKQFIRDYQAQGLSDGREPGSVKTSLNSILRNSAALFSKAALAGYRDCGMELENPFEGLKLRRVEIKGFSPLKREVLETVWRNAVLLRDGDPSAKPTETDSGPARKCLVCGGKMPKKKRIGPAAKHCSDKCRLQAKWLSLLDWSQPHPEAYLILLLELCLGLRRNESDKAQRDWLISDAQGRMFLEVKSTPYFVPKSRERRVIPVSKVLYEAIAPYFSDGDLFIVPGRSPKTYPPGKRPKNLVYRCDQHHRILSAWLQLQGINDPKPCHLLRKQFGSYIATAFGLYHAQKFLGHSSPKVTSDYYAGLVELPEVNHFTRLGDAPEIPGA